jgi:hypothetical protein
MAAEHDLQQYGDPHQDDTRHSSAGAGTPTRRSLSSRTWRRVIRSRIGVAWLLPALLLAAAYVASPFSGFSTTQPVGHPGTSVTAPPSPGR